MLILATQVGLRVFLAGQLTLPEVFLAFPELDISSNQLLSQVPSSHNQFLRWTSIHMRVLFSTSMERK